MTKTITIYEKETAHRQSGKQHEVNWSHLIPKWAEKHGGSTVHMAPTGTRGDIVAPQYKS